MRVILSANLPRYYYAVLALQEAGYLKRYICAVGIKKENSAFIKLLPSYWQKKLNGRQISGIASDRVYSIWLPELLQKGLTRIGLITHEQSNWLHDHLYDFFAAHLIQPCDIFHFVSPVGLYSAQKAKHNGSILICDVRTEHPDFQRNILIEEYSRLGIPLELPGQLTEKKIKSEFDLTDYFIVGSNYVKRTFIDAGVEAGKIFIVPLGVDLKQFSPDSDQKSNINNNHIVDEDTFRIIYAGQIIPRKGIHYLIKAFNALAIQKSELLLVGRIDKTMEPIINEATAQNPRIRTVGDIPKLSLHRYYCSSSVFVLPTLADSWGMVVLEAMACGLPVIVTENTGSQEAVRNGVDGFIVPIRSVEALQEKLLLLYQQPGLRRVMGQAGRERVKDFTWERYGQRLLDVYRTIQTRERGAR